jgi:transcriptional regulator with XRE-family HTH domain
MNIAIGENIKRMRTAKQLTQEQLSAALGVTCAAVSKWERGETYPDITQIFPLAHFFGVSCDELLGYDRDKIEAEINEIIDEYWRLYKSNNLDNYSKAIDLMKKAYRKYPNDCRIMNRYMWDMVGDAADNDPKALLDNREELEQICAKILDGCTDEDLRLNAWNMRAKILHVAGETERALDIYRTRFVNWYQSSDQKIEQLFAKDTPEFLYHVKRNMYELASFAADKLSKSVFFDKSIPKDEALRRIESYGDSLAGIGEQSGSMFFTMAAFSIYARLNNDMRNYYKTGTDEDLRRIGEKRDKAKKALMLAAKSDAALASLTETRQ